MSFCTTTKTADPPKAPAQDAGKKIILNFGGRASKAVLAMAAATLEAGGYIEPSPPRQPEIDDMPDGAIYAGVSPDTGKPMYTTPADAPLTMTFNEAAEYAARLNALEPDPDKRTWRVPTKNELSVLFSNRAAIGRFNVTGSNPAGWYWSASKNGKWVAWCQRFSDGDRSTSDKGNHLSVRCVR